ncbi:MAG: DUF4325 domain-containing protein [bacterium]|nr:DUF4325 domain-containing protein [bacterium]
MKVEIRKFGEILTSRQSGREAYAAFQPTFRQLGANEELILDFEGVQVLSPSWADEFITPLFQTLSDRLILTSTANLSVKLTIETLEGILKRTFIVRSDE